MSTNRLEAFSDGVLAVAITLLVLDIAVPDPHRTPKLGHALLAQWPIYAAYVTSFITIGIIWINHHAMISRLREVDHMVLLLNLLLLLTIGLLPFATHLIASYLKQSEGQRLAAGVYSGSFLLMSIAFAVLNRHILLVKSHLMDAKMPEERRRKVLSRSVTGLIPYALATGLAVVSAYVTLAMCAAIAAFYALPLASGSNE